MTQFVQPNYRFTGGMACAGCKGTCAGCSKGMGLFDSGFDITGWGVPEMLIAGLGLYMIVSTVFTTKRGIRSVGEYRVGRRKRKAAALRKRASELTKKGRGLFS